jgi:xylan 1,4-beta-xylosidase
VNSSGFDPSLFHDDDGRKYFLNMLWDHRPGHNRFAGIVLQEYSVTEQKLIGERVKIFEGTALGFTEGTASLQAKRLLLSPDRGGRHQLESTR